jgi:hypothetical protein
MDLLNELVYEAQLGKNIKINLESKDLGVDNIKWFSSGKKTKFCPDGKAMNNLEPVMEYLEKLYKIYKYSYPSETESKRKRSYFKALTAEEMTDEELINGNDRYLARIMLEGFIFLAVVSGELKWKGEWGSWYYQGKDKDLIVLRKWIDI